MLNFTWENISQLPQLPLKYKNFLPEDSGLYFVTMNDDTEPKIIYIGRAVNLNVRWRTHHRQVEMDFLASMGYEVSIRWLVLAATFSFLAQAETSAIRAFQPLLNNRKALRKVVEQLDLSPSGSAQPQSHFTYPEAFYTPSPPPKVKEPITEIKESSAEIKERILQLQAKGYGKGKIILELWGVSKGGSEKYKAAEAEYRRLVGE